MWFVLFFCCFRWLKHLSDATEAYQIKEGKPKHSDHSNETEEETVQELPSSSREATERAEPVGGNETATTPQQQQSNLESDSVTVDGNSNQKNGGDTATEEDKEKSLTQSDSDTSSNILSAGEWTYNSNKLLSNCLIM